jgi:hypothetical protein
MATVGMPSSQKSLDSRRPRLELSQDEQDLLQEQLATKSTDAGYLALFRYATAFDLAIYCVSMLASAAGGIGSPTMMVRLYSCAVITTHADLPDCRRRNNWDFQ